jgi:hypothetical protein
MAKLYNFPNHESGDTFPGVTFTISVNSTPLDLSGADIVATFINSLSSDISYILSVSNGRLVIDDNDGIFSLSEQIIEFTPGLYGYEITFHLEDGTVKTYIQGTWKILK